MCLIMYSKDPKNINFDDMQQAFKSNKDGFGLMYVKNDRIIHEKILPKKFKDIKKLYNKHKNNCDEIALHFRFKTQGKINIMNTHPYKVLNHKNSDRELYLMHNGPLLPIPLIENDKSDTYNFIKYYFRNILKENINLLDNKEFIESINEFIGTDKLLILDSKTKKFTIFNELEGYYENNTWYSNSYFKTKRLKKVDYQGLGLYNSNDYYSYNCRTCNICSEEIFDNEDTCYYCEQEQQQEFNFTGKTQPLDFDDLVNMDLTDLKTWVRSNIEENTEDNIAHTLLKIAQS